MSEVELKFQIPAAQRAAVDRAVAGRSARPRQRLQAAYQDTPSRTLAAAGLALRLRREGRQWVQTAKGLTDDGMTRAEDNVQRGAAAPMPAPDPQLHAGSALGPRLRELLGAADAGPLGTVYRTDIRRRVRVLSTRGGAVGRVELACDSGHIEAGGHRIDVHELEIELLAGSELAVIHTARAWVPRFGLWLDGRSKAERGDLLARGLTMAEPRLAQPVRLGPKMGAAKAWQTVARACADQIVANASQIAAGEYTPDHVHQLRVGLRRLRSALRLFGGSAAEPGLDAAAATLFRRLGAARDSTVIEAAFSAELAAAMHGAGVAGTAPAARPAGIDADPTRVVRDPASQDFLLDLLAATREAPDPAPAPPGEPERPLRRALARRLARWHRQLATDAAQFADLDDTDRHRLRKRAKRQRYAAEFCAHLFERRAVRRYLKTLRALQEQLGAFSDVLMAMQAFSAQPHGNPGALFALGWLAARRVALIDDAAPALKAFAKAEPFWKR